MAEDKDIQIAELRIKSDYHDRDISTLTKAQAELSAGLVRVDKKVLAMSTILTLVLNTGIFFAKDIFGGKIQYSEEEKKAYYNTTIKESKEVVALKKEIAQLRESIKKNPIKE